MIRPHNFLTLVLWLAAGPLLAQSRIDLSTLEKGMVGVPTQVLVLGTVHLREAPKEFRAESLQPLIDRLAAFRPDIITVERISGEGCDLFARHPAVYPPEDELPYCPETATAKAATGLDVPAAIAEVQRTLKTWPSQVTPGHRRHLAAAFLASNDVMSALVQWYELPEPERHSGDGLNDALVAQLNEASASDNESNQIAARLAARLGLQRVYPIDDHTGDNIDVADAEAYGRAVQQAWDVAKARSAPLGERINRLWKTGDVLALYRYLNRADVLRTQIDSDFGAALRDTSPKQYGRLYVSGWETRNLRMVANIHAAFRESPGARVLTIVGSSHKPWFDNLLGQMQGVRIVDVERVLE